MLLGSAAPRMRRSLLAPCASIRLRGQSGRLYCTMCGQTVGLAASAARPLACILWSVTGMRVTLMTFPMLRPTPFSAGDTSLSILVDVLVTCLALLISTVDGLPNPSVSPDPGISRCSSMPQIWLLCPLVKPSQLAHVGSAVFPQQYRFDPARIHAQNDTLDCQLPSRGQCHDGVHRHYEKRTNRRIRILVQLVTNHAQAHTQTVNRHLPRTPPNPSEKSFRSPVMLGAHCPAISPR